MVINMDGTLEQLFKEFNDQLLQLKLNKNSFYFSLNYFQNKIIDIKTSKEASNLAFDATEKNKMAIIFPVRRLENYMGYMLVIGKLTKKDRNILSILISNWARILEQTINNKQLKACSIGVMQSAIYAIEANDLYTKGHSTRVAFYSKLIASILNLPNETVSQIAYAAMLHDIGKMGISRNILNKKGPLDVEERLDIMKHPEIGAHILKPIPVMDKVIKGVLYHHERFDGKGYPKGLKGNDIPFWARIIAVADSFDAMTSSRSYRGAMPLSKAQAEIKNNAGTQFDPEIVKAFLGLDASTLQETVVSAYDINVL